METDVPNLITSQPSIISTVLVDDDASVRRILTSWIQESEGFNLLGQFPDAESASAKLIEWKPSIALVDINLPGASGIDLVRRLKPRIPETQFVMLTVYEDANYIFDALAAGATGYLLKRTPRTALITALREVQAGGSPMSSNIARKVVQSFQRKKPQTKSNDELSKRENEVLALLARGYMYKDIADLIGISVPTVNTYVRRIYEKLHVNSRGQAVALYANIPKMKKG